MPTIVITLTDSDKPELIAAVFAALQTKTVEVVETTEKPARTKTVKPAIEPAKEPEKEKTTQPEITVVQIRAKVAELIQHATNGKENKAKMKAWVTEYGATGIEDLPKEKYSEFMANLKTL